MIVHCSYSIWLCRALGLLSNASQHNRLLQSDDSNGSTGSSDQDNMATLCIVNISCCIKGEIASFTQSIYLGVSSRRPPTLASTQA